MKILFVLRFYKIDDGSLICVYTREKRKKIIAVSTLHFFSFNATTIAIPDELSPR